MKGLLSEVGNIAQGQSEVGAVTRACRSPGFNSEGREGAREEKKGGV